MRLRAGDEWRLLRTAVVAWWAFITVYITIPDYPYDWPLWYSVCMDPNGYWHEVFYIFVGFLVLGWVTFTAEERQKLLSRRYRRIKP